MIQRRLQEKRHCVPISINQSRVLLQEKDYVKRVADILKKYDTPPRYIELELTERIFRDDLTDLAKMMGELRNLGIRCDMAQGYLYAKPMPMEEFEKLLDKEIYG